MRRALTALACLLSAATCNSSSPSSKPPARGAAAPSSAAAKLPKLPADPREPMLARGISYLLEKQHLRQRPLDDGLSREVFAEYIDRLDPGKLFLLREHIELLREYEARIDDQLREANLELARTAAALLAERWKVLAKVVAEQLASPFDFTVAEEFESDPDKLVHAVSEAELAERWRKQLKLQLLERIDRGQEKDKALSWEEREKKARGEVAASWSGRFSRLARIGPLDPASTFLNALASVYDPHTTYLAPADKQNFDIALGGQLEGIGAVLGEDDHFIVVREIVPGGASWRHGGLEAGDLILAVAQDKGPPVDVADMPLDEAVQMIRGPKNTVVRLTIQKPDERVMSIAITRDVVVVEEAYARGAVIDLGPEHEPMGYIYLPSFYGPLDRRQPGVRNATADVRTLLRAFAGRKLGGVIIDVRSNGGGLLGQASGITGLLIDEGPVVQTRTSDGESKVLDDEEPGTSFDRPVVVMVDRFTASAAEILADALQDYRRAVIVGAGGTHGKGTVQGLLDLDQLREEGDLPLGVLKLTTEQFFGVSGDSTQVRGVSPDILLPDPLAHVETGERFLEHAIPWSRMPALDYQPWAKITWKLDLLAARSAERQQKQAVFATIEKRSAFLKARREQTLVPLQREPWTEYRQRLEAQLKELSPDLDDGPARLTVAPIDAAGKDAAGEALKRLEAWRKQLERDPWLEESLRILHDMVPAR